MGFWNRWPYTNFHEINLDWILDKVKQVYAAMSNYAAEWTRKLDEETQARIDGDEALNDRVDQEIKDRTEADEAEAAARQEADEQLQDNINKEQQRAEAAEDALDKKITAETERATAAENNLQEQITAEVNRATGAENTLDQKITAETSRATAREDELEGMIQTETERATAKETELGQQITTETQRATAAEEALGDRIDGIEGELDGITGAESPFIRNDGSTTTTGKIPLAMGGTSETDPAAETDLVNLRSMQAADEAIQQAMTEYVDNQLEVAMGDVHSIPAGGTAGQVLSKVDATNYNTKWIDPPSGSDPDAIKKDGTTVTTGQIPFEKGFRSKDDSYVMVPAVNLPNENYILNVSSLNAMRMVRQVDGAYTDGVEVARNGVAILIDGSRGLSGQVLTADGVGSCRWRDAAGGYSVVTDSEYSTVYKTPLGIGYFYMLVTKKEIEIETGKTTTIATLPEEANPKYIVYLNTYNRYDGGVEVTPNVNFFADNRAGLSAGSEDATPRKMTLPAGAIVTWYK